MGLVVGPGVKNGFYWLNGASGLDRPLRMSYGAAMFYMITRGISVIVGILALQSFVSVAQPGLGDKEWSRSRRWTGAGLAFLWFVWIGSWAFWSGYVKYAGDM
jgi:hypothetical protein